MRVKSHQMTSLDDDTMSDDKVVASDVLPRPSVLVLSVLQSLYLFPLKVDSFCLIYFSFLLSEINVFYSFHRDLNSFLQTKMSALLHLLTPNVTDISTFSALL